MSFDFERGIGILELGRRKRVSSYWMSKEAEVLYIEGKRKV